MIKYLLAVAFAPGPQEDEQVGPQELAFGSPVVEAFGVFADSSSCPEGGD